MATTHSKKQREATEALAVHSKGDARAVDRLLPVVYTELRSLARRYLRREPTGISLEPEALVHEAYLRLIDATQIDWKGRAHFLAVAATQMRRVLVDRARAIGRLKRGGRPLRVSLSEGVPMTAGISVDLLALDEALERLVHRNERQARVAELKLMSGMTMPEIAEIVGCSERTAHQDWVIARAWLSRWIRPNARGDA